MKWSNDDSPDPSDINSDEDFRSELGSNSLLPSQVRWSTLVILVPRSQGRERDHKFEASLGNLARPCFESQKQNSNKTQRTGEIADELRLGCGGTHL